MASCRECSSPIAEGDRFCRRCGSLLVDDIEVLSTEQAVTSAHLARQGPSRVALLVGAGALVVTGMFWVLSRSSDKAAVTEGDERAASVAGDESGDDGTDPEEAVDGDEDGRGADVSGADVSGADGTEQTDTTDGDRGAAEEHALAIDEPGPVLGNEVGLSLWIGGSGHLSRIDLDTAEVQRFDLTRRVPVLVSGGWLVLAALGGGDGLFSVPLDNPNAEEVRLGLGTYISQFIHPSIDNPDQLWVLSNARNGAAPMWQSVRLSDGEIIDELPAGLGPFTGVTSGPELASAPDGGIYERRNGEYVRVAEGSLAAVSDARVLVRTCTSPTSCDAHWLDRSSWERVDGPAINDELLDSTFPSWLSAGGRVMFTFSFEGEAVYDLERGSKLAVSGDIWALRPGSVSSDERLIALMNNDTPEIHNLDTGDVYRLDELDFPGEAGMLFTKNG